MMTNEENTLSSKEATEALKNINATTSQVVKTNRPPILLSLLICISYSSIVFGYGMAEHGNNWALAMWLGFFFFAISVGLYLYTYRLLGVKPTIIPKTKNSVMMNLIIGVIFAVLIIAGREVRLAGFEFAPHLAALLAGVTFFITLQKYPTGEYVEKENSNGKA